MFPHVGATFWAGPGVALLLFAPPSHLSPSGEDPRVCTPPSKDTARPHDAVRAARSGLRGQA